jgi:hypothetical protein
MRWATRLTWFLTCLFSVELNPCTGNIIPVVLIKLSRHEDPLWFGISAVAGCIAVVGLEG